MKTNRQIDVQWARRFINGQLTDKVWVPADPKLNTIPQLISVGDNDEREILR
jgi:hypothetical protein